MATPITAVAGSSRINAIESFRPDIERLDAVERRREQQPPTIPPVPDSTATETPPDRRPDPEALRDAIGGLVNRQVDAGQLTNDQAALLGGLFEQPEAPAQQASARTAEAQRPPPPQGGNGPNTSDAADETQGSRAFDALATFLENLKNDETKKVAYGATGSPAVPRAPAPMLVDFQV